ncbi:signal peptidase I [Legionella taurinensis]|uniref:Signal peptidase I n=1 Tax=Legionella taurinensis TaxID=70611 RepID=A0A3A5L9V2_9GAMM|nr:signal peptidase I [Legionella taurinensis]MDX1837329.1 signal peptidase I [Legionella taurinensis]PUT40684.1 signal peptidase I [Legionella taurinensis]PUT44106.1 signal peptidase I [Legionella taurinensis]PUT47407.1 signal peptidase I [Legionella taurinensis]PUT48546.1 signal peptidase I [Legionella taurinensis]
MNFALLLVVLSAVSGFIYLLDILFWAKKREPDEQPGKIIEYARSFFPVFFIVLLLRSFLVEPFRIPSGSLEPTLLVGDFLAVNKFAYGLRLPVWEKKIIPIANPKTGEIAVFRWPPNPGYDYIKRVIGVPGDKISYRNKVLYINGQEARQTFIEYTTDESSGKAVARYSENLNGVDHDIYVRPDVPASDFEIEVPPGYYFMMGDNRDDSADSRFWGFVEDQYLRGKAFFVWMSWNGKTDSLRWSKIGRFIH